MLMCDSLHDRLIMGFMCVTAFVSMWISNTATASMMLPIAHSVLEQLRKNLMEYPLDRYAMDVDSIASDIVRSDNQQFGAMASDSNPLETVILDATHSDNMQSEAMASDSKPLDPVILEATRSDTIQSDANMSDSKPLARVTSDTMVDKGRRRYFAFSAIRSRYVSVLVNLFSLRAMMR